MIFFIDLLLLSVSVEALSPASGRIFGTVELQAHVLGHVLAVQSEVLSQSLENLLHGNITPFGSIEVQSPASGHLK